LSVHSTLINDTKEGLTGAQLQSIEKIMKSSNELTNFISRILNITRIDQSRIKVNKDVVDINAAIESIIDEQMQRAIEDDIQIITKLNPIFSIEVDEGLIRQALSNLLENAIKYSPPNSKIMIMSEEKEDCVEIVFEDEGHGIPEKDIPKIFDKFYRVDEDWSKAKKGSGLGLYLVKYFIELHNGKVFVENRSDGGARFIVNLPLGAS
jgi:hypothetical protein